MFSRKFNIVGACISRERKKAGLSQEALAEQLHVTRQTISNWESGKSLPDIESLKTLAQALNVPIERLIYEKQATQPGETEQTPAPLFAAISHDLKFEEGFFPGYLVPQAGYLRFGLGAFLWNQRGKWCHTDRRKQCQLCL